MNENLIDLSELLEESKKEASGNIISDMKQFITGRVAANFPSNLNKVIDEWFTQEISPSLKIYLDENRELILNQTKDRILGYAMEKINQKIKETIGNILDGISREY